MSFKNCWTISSSYDFRAHQQRSQRRCRFPQTTLPWIEVLPGLSSALPDLLALPGMSSALPDLSPELPDLLLVLPGAPKVLSAAPRCSQTYHNHSHGTPVPVIRDPSYSEGRPECPPKVWYSPDIDPSEFTLHILSDTPGDFQWLNYILLMQYARKWDSWLIAAGDKRYHGTLRSKRTVSTLTWRNWGNYDVGLR